MASTNNTFPITRYELPIPLNVEIANTKREFAKMQWANPGALVLPENGGYYLKRHPEGKVVAIASDRLCSITDNAYMSLIYYLESQGLYEEANDHMEDLRKAGIDADKLKAEASDEIKSGACVRDDGVEVDADTNHDDTGRVLSSSWTERMDLKYLFQAQSV